ncbi:MAG: hypothetical protein NWQ46_07630, partial [Spirosomaceae bacterium]|nr:hypothetical protein [Spirosomataceae bacterium]
MNKNLLLLLTLFVGFARNAQNTQSFSKSSLIIDGNPLDITGVSGGLGTFNCNTTIGFETVAKQCGTCNVSSASMAFRVYKIGETPGDFIAISAPFASETTAGNCKSRTFRNDDIKSLLLQNLKNGDYNLEIYFQSNGEGCDIINLQSVTYSTTFTYAKEPTIVFQPIDLISCTGGDAFFKTSATGVGALTYRWQMSD